MTTSPIEPSQDPHDACGRIAQCLLNAGLHEPCARDIAIMYRHLDLMREILTVVPVGYLPNHTYASLPSRISELLHNYALVTAQLEKLDPDA